MRNELTQAELKRQLHYDPETGIFTRLVGSSTAKKGEVTGYIGISGYVYLGINRYTWKAHRLAFLYMTGSIPKLVDHKDRIRHNNIWDNLRAANDMQNAYNKPVQRNNKIGLKGVRKHKKKFGAAIRINHKHNWLGVFDTPEEAHQAYLNFAKAHHGEFYAEK